jgi:DNA-binding NtrC family response regulator
MNNHGPVRLRTEGPFMADAHAPEPISPARLLLIDADRTLHGRLAEALAADFESPPVVVEVNCGRAAIELCRGAPYDLVLAELDALADISERSDDRITRLVRGATDALVVMLVAEASISVALGAMRAGAHECVAASTEPGALVRRIGELARRHGQARLVTRSARPAPITTTGAAYEVPSIPVMRDLVLPMWRQEQKIIEDAIQTFAGNIALAAAALELSPSTIYRKRQAWAELDGRRADLALVSAR